MNRTDLQKLARAATLTERHFDPFTISLLVKEILPKADIPNFSSSPLIRREDEIIEGLMEYYSTDEIIEGVIERDPEIYLQFDGLYGFHYRYAYIYEEMEKFDRSPEEWAFCLKDESGAEFCVMGHYLWNVLRILDGVEIKWIGSKPEDDTPSFESLIDCTELVKIKCSITFQTRTTGKYLVIKNSDFPLFIEISTYTPADIFR